MVNPVYEYPNCLQPSETLRQAAVMVVQVVNKG